MNYIKSQYLLTGSVQKNSNDQMRQEMMFKCRQYVFRGLGQNFDAIATINDTILTKTGDVYTWKDIM